MAACGGGTEFDASQHLETIFERPVAEIVEPASIPGHREQLVGAQCSLLPAAGVHAARRPRASPDDNRRDEVPPRHLASGP